MGRLDERDRSFANENRPSGILGGESRRQNKNSVGRKLKMKKKVKKVKRGKKAVKAGKRIHIVLEIRVKGAKGRA